MPTHDRPESTQPRPERTQTSEEYQKRDLAREAGQSSADPSNGQPGTTASQADELERLNTREENPTDDHLPGQRVPGKASESGPDHVSNQDTSRQTAGAPDAGQQNSRPGDPPR